MILGRLLFNITLIVKKSKNIYKWSLSPLMSTAAAKKISHDSWGRKTRSIHHKISSGRRHHVSLLSTLTLSPWKETQDEKTVKERRGKKRSNGGFERRFDGRDSAEDAAQVRLPLPMRLQALALFGLTPPPPSLLWPRYSIL